MAFSFVLRSWFPWNDTRRRAKRSFCWLMRSTRPTIARREKKYASWGSIPIQFPTRDSPRWTGLFLDANILFSAAYQPKAGMLELWNLDEVTLCSSRYALEEARMNLPDEEQRLRLERICQSLDWFEASRATKPQDLSTRERFADPVSSYRGSRYPPTDG